MIFKTISLPRISVRKIEGKSRRDGTLLTVDFNLRTINDSYSPQDPAGTAQWRDKVSSLQDLLMTWQYFFRRLKPAVHQVLSPAGHLVVDTTLLQVVKFSLLSSIFI